ncbi:hypothetical protein TGAM01_v207832 [Trichoderma gamsii]|uniref:Uncharacterized protein n=1 Tax=Trichoderma gamsii TaxID=398673 RepID=A0A2P4ZG85_9HYPO|nr:hypothetical protein TGAM01_v207832 [Trichoderma gamsii]PON23305.1 hypothetical protein TGAM01_v207832 [Trichoderma gamsii]
MLIDPYMRPLPLCHLSSLAFLHLHVDWLPLSSGMPISLFFGYSRILVSWPIALPLCKLITLGCLSALQSIHYTPR